MTSDEAACSNVYAMPSTSNKSPDFQKISIIQDDDTSSVATNLQTWAMCPMGRTRAVSLVGFVCLYAFIFLFCAPRSTVILITMTSLIAVWIVLLYVTGLLCVLYMMLKQYPPLELEEETVGTPFDKMGKRVSPNSNHADAVKEFKF